MGFKSDPQVGDADPVFKIVTERDPIYQSGDRGIVISAGSKLFVFGKEIPHVEAFKYETDFNGPNSVVRTTITIKLAGAQVETQFKKFVPLAKAKE